MTRTSLLSHSRVTSRMSLDKPWTRAYSDQDLSSLEEFLSSNDSPPATRRTTPLLDSLMPSLSVLKNNSITETDSLMEVRSSTVESSSLSQRTSIR